MNQGKIDLNEQFKKALFLMEDTPKNVFITGKAGTGKSTLLDYFRGYTQKKVVVLAPTGVAALNVKGQTIHSFFSFKPDITLETVKKLKEKKGKENLYKNIDTIVIDEISMVRADLLDCVDKFLRLNGRDFLKPFGGVQMIFIGDLYQLPPVVVGEEKGIFKNYYQSEYFFDSLVFKNLEMELVELEKIYRQKDQNFISLLNSIRNNSAGADELEAINGRFKPEFETKTEEFYITLTTTNKLSEEINQKELQKLPGKKHFYQAEINGEFDEKYLPTDINLFVKVGAQIMLLNNDSALRWVNGTIGKIVGIRKVKDIEDEVVLVELGSGEIEEVVPYTWEIFKFAFNEKTGSLESETVGSFTQYPLKLAWSVTIHKSQGKTFDKVVIDIGRGTFAHGQMYVALSRCTSLEGIILKKRIEKKHILMDWRVVKFMTGYQYQKAEETFSLSEKINLLEKAIKESRTLEIVYLKANDEKSRRFLKPELMGEMEYQGKTFLGVAGFDSKREDSRTFRVDRILEIKTLD